MKKIIISSFFIIILFLLSSCTHTTSVLMNETETDSHEYTVYVLIKKEYSEIGKEYHPEDFDKKLVESVEIINQINPDDDISGFNMEYWQQALKLELKEPTKENAEKVINAAYKNPQVESASTDNIAFSVANTYINQ